jgi:hypothetical protein
VREWGYTPLKFAGPIKEMLRALGLNDKHLEGELKELPSDLIGGQSPRHAMQTLGTEWGRMVMGRNFWADMWVHNATRILDEGRKVVVDDCRFPNELQSVLSLGGTSVGIRRPNLNPVWAHVSEEHYLGADYEIINDRDTEHLLTQLRKIINLR